jgi:hypothetical protein
MAEEKILQMVSHLRETTTHPNLWWVSNPSRWMKQLHSVKKYAKNGWVNLDIKQSKGGNYYCELDTWVAKPKSEPKAEPVQADTSSGEDLPF